VRTYNAFCAGAGLGCEGFRIAEFKCKLLVEWDEERQDVLRKNHKGSPIKGDITKLTGAEVPKADVWFATLPCQPYSIAGRRKGLSDGRGGPILLALLRLLRECVELGTGPKLLLWENVKGSLDGNHEAAKRLCTEIGRLGFRPLWGEILNSNEFGVAQDRKRVFLLFGRNSDFEDLCLKNLAEGRRPSAQVCLSKLRGCEMGQELNTEQIMEIEPRLRKRSGSAQLSDNMLRKASEFTSLQPPRRDWAGKAIFHSARNPRCFQAGFSPTLTKDCRLMVRISETGSIRKVAPRGYERLMGVRRDLTRSGQTATGETYEIEASHRRDMCGDGVVAKVAEWIARAIEPLL
jgi:DNA-cytosine methyltransferase